MQQKLILNKVKNAKNNSKRKNVGPITLRMRNRKSEKWKLKRGFTQKKTSFFIECMRKRDLNCFYKSNEPKKYYFLK
jgi:hypothetical protein